MRRAAGAVVLLASIVVGAVGVLWAVFKIVGTEWDYCGSGGGCTSGYAFALPLIALGVVGLLLGLRLVRSGDSGADS